jgi:hypothetical protein
MPLKRLILRIFLDDFNHPCVLCEKLLLSLRLKIVVKKLNRKGRKGVQRKRRKENRKWTIK